MERHLEEDARPFDHSPTEPTQPTEHYDAAIVFAEEDEEQAMAIMDDLNKLVLDDEEKPKVCLYGDPKGAESQIEAGMKITRVCTLVLVLATRHLQNDTVALLIKDEAIGNTRLAKHCHKDLRHCVRPIYVEKVRSYRPPAGLSAITPINWYDKDTRFFKRNIKLLFNQHMPYRRQRESKQQRSASCSSFNGNNQQSNVTESPDHTQNNNFNVSNREAVHFNDMQSSNPISLNSCQSVDLSTRDEVQLPASRPVQSASNTYNLSVYRGSTISRNGSYESGQEEYSTPPNHSSEVQAGAENNTLGHGRSSSDFVASSVRGNAYNLSVCNEGTLSRNGSTDSGQGRSISPQNIQSVVPPAAEHNNVGGSQAARGQPQVSMPEQAAGHQGFPDGISAPQGSSSQEDALTSDPTTASSKTTGNNSKGFSVEENPSQLSIDEADIVTDSSLQSRSNQKANTEETGDIISDHATSTVTAVSNSLQTIPEGANAKEGQHSGEKAQGYGSCSKERHKHRSSDESTREEGEDKISTIHKTDLPQVSKNDADQTQPKTIVSEEDKADVGKHVLSFTGPAHTMTAKCAAPNEITSCSRQKVPMFPEVCAPAVVHYHTHYHKEVLDTLSHTGQLEIDTGSLQQHHPIGPRLFPSTTGMPRSPRQAPEREVPAQRPINIVNCDNVQIGAGTMKINRSIRSRNVEDTNTSTESDRNDRPPEYSLEDPLVSTPTLQSPLFPSRAGGGRIEDQTRGNSDFFTTMKMPIGVRETTLAGGEGKWQGEGRGGRDYSGRAEKNGHDQRLLNAKPLTNPSSLPVTDAAKSFSDKYSSDESDDSSLHGPRLGSGDDLKGMLMTSDDNKMTESTGGSEAGPESDRSEGKSTSSSNASFSSCRMFCRDTRRLNMLTASRMVSLVETCVDCGSYGSELD